jgi:hypothetical protein
MRASPSTPNLADPALPACRCASVLVGPYRDGASRDGHAILIVRFLHLSSLYFFARRVMPKLRIRPRSVRASETALEHAKPYRMNDTSARNTLTSAPPHQGARVG